MDIQDYKNRYKGSEELFQRASKVIPGASQTFSKSSISYPREMSPLFLDKGEGCHVWDIDGNQYIDLVMGLLPNVLGYQDRDVDKAIKGQMERGITFSLATELEVKLAEKLIELIPSAEMVRFGKNGSDATSAAIRVARAYTGRDKILACGYHGWQDWYIGATSRSKGVPSSVQSLTYKFPYGDLEALEKLFEANEGEFAALIMEPMNHTSPAEGYLQSVKELAQKHGTLLIFDEIITGFRFSLGGAQSYFGVTPDLSTFGKSMANGMPISALVGKKKYMLEMEDIFFSSTFGGETLSIAASLATIEKMEKENVIDYLWTIGQELKSDVLNKIKYYKLEDAVSLNGLPPWLILSFKDCKGESKEAIKTLFLREMLSQGILIGGSNNISYAFGRNELAEVLNSYGQVLSVLRGEINKGYIENRLGCKPVKPVFSVR